MDKKNVEISYTPGFVVCRHTDDHPSRLGVAAKLQQPTRRRGRAALIAFCLALLPMRLAMRPTVTNGPVVSYTAISPLPDRNQAVYFLLRYLSGCPGRTLSAIVLYGARKFLNECMQRLCASAHTRRGHQEISTTPYYQSFANQFSFSKISHFPQRVPAHLPAHQLQ